jgi:hypothetical protein
MPAGYADGRSKWRASHGGAFGKVRESVSGCIPAVAAGTLIAESAVDGGIVPHIVGFATRGG